MRFAVSLGTFGLLIVIGCSSGQSGRLASYLGPELTRTTAPATGRVRLPAEGLKAGLLVINDTTGPDSAPPLSAPRWAVMENLVRAQVEQSLPIRLVKVLSSAEISGVEGSAQLLELGRRHDMDHLVFAVLSSQDHEEPTHLGQGYMMTQMPGVTVVNRALMEIALLDVNAGTLVVRVKGRGSELLEELDVPLGRGQPSKSDARDILRVNAGKHALDRAMWELKEKVIRISPH